jgi:hypothetical protein
MAYILNKDQYNSTLYIYVPVFVSVTKRNFLRLFCSTSVTSLKKINIDKHCITQKHVVVTWPLGVGGRADPRPSAGASSRTAGRTWWAGSHPVCSPCKMSSLHKMRTNKPQQSILAAVRQARVAVRQAGKAVRQARDCCKAGLSSILGSAPQGGFSHWAYKRWGDGERPRRMATDKCVVWMCLNGCMYVIKIW